MPGETIEVEVTPRLLKASASRDAAMSVSPTFGMRAASKVRVSTTATSSRGWTRHTRTVKSAPNFATPKPYAVMHEMDTL